MLRWQIAEYSSLAYLLPMVMAANRQQARAVEERIPFGPHPQQYVLFCRPPERSANTLVFFAHGGGWSAGNPWLFRFIGRYFAGLGFPTVLAGYRLAPRFKYPAQMQDIYAGLHAGLEAAAARGVLATQVLLGGQSAGAHLVSLLAYDRDEAARRKLEVRWAGVLAISGPLDFSFCASRTAQGLVNDFVGGAANWNKADPIRYIRGDETIPVLCIHGARDPLVDMRCSLSFVNRANRGGQDLAQAHIIQGGHHSDLVKLFLRDSDSARFMASWLVKLMNRVD